MSMEEKWISLQFNSMVTRLAGYDYGKEVYHEQVENQIDFSSRTIIEFPNQIVKIASSFVQGFFAGIIEQVGLDQIGSQVVVKAGSPEVVESVLGNLT